MLWLLLYSFKYCLRFFCRKWKPATTPLIIMGCSGNTVLLSRSIDKLTTESKQNATTDDRQQERDEHSSTNCRNADSMLLRHHRIPTEVQTVKTNVRGHCARKTLHHRTTDQSNNRSKTTGYTYTYLHVRWYTQSNKRYVTCSVWNNSSKRLGAAHYSSLRQSNQLTTIKSC